MKKTCFRYAAFAFLLLGAQKSFAQIDLSKPIPMDPDVKMGKLANGLTYYIQKNTKPEKKMELRLVINAGSVLEDKDQQGLAHFMEHMSFNGSKHFPKNELVNYLQKIGVQFGADLNAYTSFDETVYILPISSNDPKIVEEGFTVLEDWAFNNLLDKQEIDKERGVVLEEARLSKGADERMRRQYFPALFNGSKYAERLPIGKDSILKTFKPAALERFYKQWYRPNLMAVVVVGDIDPAEAEKKIRAHFGSFKNPAAAPVRPSIIPIKARTKPEAMVVTDKEATNTIVQIYNYVKPSKPVKTWADYRQSLVQNVVNSLINQRLQELTQKENPPFLYASTSTGEFIRGYDAFTSFAVLSGDATKDAVDALIGETDRARQYGFLQAELDRVKANMITGAERAVKEKGKSESSNIVWSYVNNFLQGTPVPGAEMRLQFLKQVLPGLTLKELNAEAAKMPSATNAFALITAPESMKAKLPTAADLQKEVMAAANLKVKAYEEKAIGGSLTDNNLMAGKVTQESTNEKLGTVNYTLSNGATITIKQTSFKNDQILMDAWRRGGFQSYPLADKDNVKNAAILVSQMGVKDFTPTDMRKYLSGKTANVTPYINDNSEGIEGFSSVKDFETFLQLVHVYLTEPRKDPALFNSYISKQKSSLQFIRQNPQAFYQDTMMKIAYNNNPWAEGIPTVEDYNRIDLDKSLNFYKQIFGNIDGMHFTFVGNIDPAVAKPLLEKYIGSLQGTPATHQFKDVGLRLVKGPLNANIKKGTEAQSLINILWEGEAKYSREDRMALAALLEVMNIKVVEKLREEMGGMYSGGMGGQLEKIPYEHYSIQAYIPCGPENVDKLTTALFDLIKNTQQNGVEQKDLDKVKETMKKQMQVSLQTNDTWLSSLSNSFLNQENPENILDVLNKIDQLTVKDLQNAAVKYLSVTNYVRTVLYPENAKISEDGKKPF